MKKFVVILLLFSVYIFAISYHAYRFVIEYTKDAQYTRYEEVFYKDGDKIVFVKSPKKVVWVKLGEKYYIGTTNELKLCPPIKDLEDIFYDYANFHKISLDVDGEITISEKAFTMKAIKINGMLEKIIRKFENVITEMIYIYVPSRYTFEDILSSFKLIDKSEIPEKIYDVFNLLLWFNVEYEDDKLKVYAVDKNGENVIFEISDKSGDFQVENYYITILEASDDTRKEIEDEISSNN
ncbi:hypothetical protein [Thermosipho atlanticus]|uniref:Uncharacterized protein n=1 Tax=Thermosipho atlanticus DSM 15807 TaxID=1123380 RepID=A0A1M5TMK8_9BACT|nr:hypothetical protein [Thermosipho atlanticus]SHH51901.1 hypothetical protein SAMN02745199_1401 [Thermosipho atlanticus DSM 15807]